VSYQIHQPAIPNADDKWTAAEHHGNLLLFFPTEVRRGIKTSNGDADAVACARVVNLDTGRVLHNTLIFGTALVPNIGPAAPDGVVAGRLSQGEGKPGQSKPWILLPHDEAELRRVQEWLALDAQGQVQQPQTQQAPPAQGGWGQQAAPSAPAAGGWGAPVPAPAPATYSPVQAQQTGNGWGAPAPAAPPAAQSQFPAASWGNAAPAAPPAPPAGPAPDVHPGLVEALRKKGVPGEQLTSMAQAEQIWALVQNQPDVA
jgi:hypothetical protein